MSDFRRSKLIFVFKTFFDLDNSGSIDQEDFKLYAERVCKTHGWTVNEGKGAVAYQRVMSIWDALKKVDADGDGTVDQEEWCTMWNNLAQGQGSQEWQEKYRDLIFSQIDTSGEGTIEEDEFTAVVTKYGAVASDSSEAFNRMTKNKSVTVDAALFARLWNEFFSSDDPSAPGNFIFGRLTF